MTQASIRYFDSFTSRPGGGNRAGIICGAEGMDGDQMQSMARQIGAPASCFLRAIEGDEVHVRFFSPRSEYPMCGHAAIGLFTLLNQKTNGSKSGAQTLLTPSAKVRVYVESSAVKSPRIMLDLPVPKISALSPASTEIAELLKIPLEAISRGIPPLAAAADFRHLMVQIASPSKLVDISPNFDEIARFCKAQGSDSLALYATKDEETVDAYQIREFCPAIGVDESAAAGTTNASLACCLAAHGKLGPYGNGITRVTAHQGAAVGRPSVITCAVSQRAGKITGVRAGGQAVEVSKAASRDNGS